MKRNSLGMAAGLLAAFVVWTLVICFVDVRPIGPDHSSVGLAGINQFVHNLTGVNLSLYYATDWLGLVPIGVCMGFCILGLVQWIKRKHIRKVDWSILALGGFYILTITVYLLFEIMVINYRPVLIDGMLEASYPSSTTLLTMCVMPTAAMQLNTRIQNKALRRCVLFAIIAFTAFMVIGRILSGVHWITDIIGGALLSAGLVILYRFVVQMKEDCGIRRYGRPFTFGKDML